MTNLIQDRIRTTAFAFRGYNLTNLGRSPQLLEHYAYGSVVRRYLEEAGAVSSEVLGKRVRLVERVKRRQDTTIRSYSEAIAIIVAMEMAQIHLLEEFHGVEYRKALLAFGYSLGELAALTAGGVFTMADMLRVPLAMAKDCVQLAKDVTMAVLFSRGPALSLEQVVRLCLRISCEGHGTIGVSSVLAPNSFLVLGQGKTIARFKELMHTVLPAPIHIRVNPNQWPPLHTPIIWQRNIPNRAAVMMQTMTGGFNRPTPKVISMVTGEASYNDYNARAILHQWVDHPQLLWNAVYETLSSGADTVIHVGPEPNLIPATFKRVSDNVREQIAGRSLGSLGLRAMSNLVQRQWLSALLPSRSALLRAPMLRHISLEDWLLEQKVS